MVNFITIKEKIDYLESLKMMEDTVDQLINKSCCETVYLVEHSEVYTAGTNYKSSELLCSNEIDVIYTNRGGKFTYHGQGQRVIYPILDLTLPNRFKDVKRYVQTLEEWIILTLAHFDVKAFAEPTRIGVWTKYNNSDAKIAAIGIRIKKWITYHGIAVNIATDLNKYHSIIPCGITNYQVTSLKQLGVQIDMIEFDEVLKKTFSRVFS